MRSKFALASLVALSLLAGIVPTVAEPLTLIASPEQPGPDLPPAGRSLFDVLFELTPQAGAREDARYSLPYPFERLVAQIEARVAPATARSVLIPLGRSLQRFAADPDFFAAPRVVVAIDAQGHDCGRSCLALNDRLFLGYQPRANVIEVISYNEEGGRFEFQVVEDYAPGREPRVRYAARALCSTCHQPQAPIFAIALWSESNSNPRVGAKLAQHAARFHGVPARQPLNEANAIDLSTDRASRIAFANFVWDRGCELLEKSAACRAALLAGALRLRQRGQPGSAGPLDGRLAQALHESLTDLAPGGLAVPSPDFPDRDPLRAVEAGADPSDAIEADGSLDPTHPRLPLVFWEPSDPPEALLAILARDIATFFLPQDFDLLSRIVAEHGQSAESGTSATDSAAAAFVELAHIGTGAGRGPLAAGPIRRTAIVAAIRAGLDARRGD